MSASQASESGSHMSSPSGQDTAHIIELTCSMCRADPEIEALLRFSSKLPSALWLPVTMTRIRSEIDDITAKIHPSGQFHLGRSPRAHYNSRQASSVLDILPCPSERTPSYLCPQLPMIPAPPQDIASEPSAPAPTTSASYNGAHDPRRPLPRGPLPPPRVSAMPDLGRQYWDAVGGLPTVGSHALLQLSRAAPQHEAQEYPATQNIVPRDTPDSATEESLATPPPVRMPAVQVKQEDVEDPRLPRIPGHDGALQEVAKMAYINLQGSSSLEPNFFARRDGQTR